MPAAATMDQVEDGRACAPLTALHALRNARLAAALNMLMVHAGVRPGYLHDHTPSPQHLAKQKLVALAARLSLSPHLNMVDVQVAASGGREAFKCVLVTPQPSGERAPRGVSALRMTHTQLGSALGLPCASNTPWEGAREGAKIMGSVSIQATDAQGTAQLGCSLAEHGVYVTSFWCPHAREARAWCRAFKRRAARFEADVLRPLHLRIATRVWHPPMPA